jgi:hypothetical protein
MCPRVLITALLTLAAAAAAVPIASADDDRDRREPTLVQRAILPADATAPAPFAGAPNTDPVFAPGARQPVGGFSALLDSAGRDTFWAMPDNGFGSKANSRSFLLRVYRVRADFETARGGAGDVKVLDWISLSDPGKRVPFEIVNEGTDERLLTGGDFDVESMRVARDGTLWFGEEFGPFLLHTDAEGKVLEAPIPLPGVSSPDNPLSGGEANLGRSNGFEGMAISKDRRTLYPVLEGAVAGDDPHVRRVYEFDLGTERYVGRRADYRVADPAFLVADFTALDEHRYVALERDNAEGEAAQHKRAFTVNLRRTGDDGSLAKRQVVDLLDLRDPALISLPGRPGDVGLGDPFAMPYVTIESVLPVGGDRLAIVNDTNFGSTGRNPELPDYSDLIVVAAPGLRGAGDREDREEEREERREDREEEREEREEAREERREEREERDRDRRGGAFTSAVIGDTPYGPEQITAFPRLVDDVNDDGDVRQVVHLGDIKNGSSRCSDERFRTSLDLYNTFEDPFVLTLGDNEWTDCHRESAGGFLPIERLERLRELFYPRSGRTLGERTMAVRTQADDPRFGRFVENQMWTRARTVFSLVHVVGSDNDLAPWFGAAETPEQRALRLAEFERRLEADLAWLDETFARAERRRARGVVLGMQADTFVGDRRGMEAINQRIEELAGRFDGPVLLLQGDTHTYKVDRPLPEAPNLTRLVVEGETADEWLRLRIDPRDPKLFTWERMPL